MKDKTGRPENTFLEQRNYHDLEGASKYFTGQIKDADLIPLTQNRLWWHDGKVDGGDMDGVSPAMDNLDPASFDGGAL